MSSEKKSSTQNIITAVVAGVALVLVLIVVLVKVGVFEKKDEKPAPELESSVVYASETMENGDVVYYTMVDYYVKPGISSFYVYPTTEPPSTEPESTIQYIEETELVQMTDAEGYLLVDENGVPLTQVVVHTIPVTEAPTGDATTAYVPRTQGMAVTDKLHRVKKDENGNPLTEIVTLDPYPTEPPASGESLGETTASEGKKKNDASKEEALAAAIVSAINEARTANELPPLSNSSDLRALASTKNMSQIFPDLYGKISLPSAAYSFTTDYGGSALCDNAVSQAGSSVLSDSISQVGTSVIKYKGTYYTTVLFK